MVAEQDHAQVIVRVTWIVGVVALMAVLPGCKAAPGDVDQPARVVEPTSESRAALLHVVSAALNGADVTLANDALTRSNLLTIEPKAYRNTQHNRIVGRDLTTPAQFRLLKRGAQCFLVQQSNSARWLLAHTKCEVE